MLLLPQRAWSRLVGSGQGAVRHITQWALPVWSTTQVWVPGHTTLEQDSAGKHTRLRLSLPVQGEPGTVVLLPRLLQPKRASSQGNPGDSGPLLPLASVGQRRAGGVQAPASPLLTRTGAGRG